MTDHTPSGLPQPQTVAEFHNPWRTSLENCISGDNYLRAGEYRDLIADLDRLYALEQGAPAPAVETVAGAQPVVADTLTDAEKRQLIGNYFAEAWAKEAAWNMLDDYDRRADHG